MAELSKTARASMGKATKEVHVETTEEAIKAIRDNRAGELHIGDMSRVDKLLQAYDKAISIIQSEVNENKRLCSELEYIKTGRQIIPAEIPAQEEDPNHMQD